MDSLEEILAERVELLERSVKAAEATQSSAGIDFVDDEGNFVKHIDLRQDPEPYKVYLALAQKRLDTYRESLV